MKRTLLILSLLFSLRCFAQTEQQVLDAGGPEAKRVIDKAYEQFASAQMFEHSDVGWGTPSASCWALTVLIRYDRVEASERFEHIFTHSDKPFLRLYALLGLHLLHPNEPRWVPTAQPTEFLQQKVWTAAGCIREPAAIRDILRELRDGGGYDSLLLHTPLPRLYQTHHPPQPPHE